MLRNILFDCLKNNSLNYLSYDLGDFLDIESSSFFKKTSGLLGFSTLKNSLHYVPLNDFRHDYGCTQLSLINSLEETNLPDAIYLIHSSPRFESPLLNLKIRRFNDEFGVNIFKVGVISNTNYNFVHISHVLSSSLLNKISLYNSPLIFTSASIYLPDYLINKINLSISDSVSSEVNLIPS